MTLEQILNTLIQRGWKPFGHNAIKLDYDWMKTRYWYWAITYKYRDSYIDDDWDEVEYEEWRRQFNLRELVSKESGLWQFVCENKKLHNFPRIRIKNPILCDEWIKDVDKDCNDNFYEYWLIECALCDEDKLEDFLIENIKVWNED